MQPGRIVGKAGVQLRGQTAQVSAEEVDAADLELWWPKIIDVWPAFADHYANTGERTMFRLHPIHKEGRNVD